MSCKKPDVAQRLRRVKTETDMKKMGIKENCDEKKKKEKGRNQRKEKKKGCANVKRCKNLCEEKDKKRRRYVTV